MQAAVEIFNGTGENITTHDKKHIGAVIGHSHYKGFVVDLLEKWTMQIKVLAEIGTFEPQAATAFATCIRHQYTFYMQTIPEISELLKPLEIEIRLCLIPALL